MKNNIKLPPLKAIEIRKMFANPMYCLSKVQGWEIHGSGAIIDKKIWIKAAEKLIKEVGAKQFLVDLLDNLEDK